MKDFNNIFKKQIIGKTIGVKPFINDADKIIQIAKQQGITKGEVIRIIIHDWFENVENRKEI